MRIDELNQSLKVLKHQNVELEKSACQPDTIAPKQSSNTNYKLALATRKKHELVEASKTMKAKLHEIREAREAQSEALAMEIEIKKQLQERKQLTSPNKNIFSAPPSQPDQMMEQIEKIEEENRAFLIRNKKIFLESKALEEEIRYWEVDFLVSSICKPFLGREQKGRQRQGLRPLLHLLRVQEEEADETSDLGF